MAAAAASSATPMLVPGGARSCAPSSSGRSLAGCTSFVPPTGAHQRHGRGDVGTHARQGGRSRRAEPEVELDDEYQRPAFGLDLLPLAGGRVLRTASKLADRFVDVAYDLAPAGTSRQVVETATKGGLLLVTLAFANSILSFLLQAGFVLLAGYLATRVFGVQLFSSGQPQPSLGPPPGPAKKARKRSTKQAASKSQFNTPIGQAAGDLADVWFEPKPEPPKRRGRPPKQAP